MSVSPFSQCNWSTLLGKNLAQYCSHFCIFSIFFHKNMLKVHFWCSLMQILNVFFPDVTGPEGLQHLGGLDNYSQCCTELMHLCHTVISPLLQVDVCSSSSSQVYVDEAEKLIPHQYLLYFGFDNLNTPHLFYNFNFTSYNLLQPCRDCLGFNIHFMLPTHWPSPHDLHCLTMFDSFRWAWNYGTVFSW